MLNNNKSLNSWKIYINRDSLSDKWLVRNLHESWPLFNQIIWKGIVSNFNQSIIIQLQFKDYKRAWNRFPSTFSWKTKSFKDFILRKNLILIKALMVLIRQVYRFLWKDRRIGTDVEARRKLIGLQLDTRWYPSLCVASTIVGTMKMDGRMQSNSVERACTSEARRRTRGKKIAGSLPGSKVGYVPPYFRSWLVVA